VAKKRQRKLPVGWSPGVGNRGTDHPSVVRDRDPEVRARLQAGLDGGYKHARFDANPACCPICSRLDGRRHLIKTVLRWKHVLPHPNCLCTWSPTGLNRAGTVSQNFPKNWPDWPKTKKGHDEMGTVRLISISKANSTLHEELVDVHRGGKTFKRRQKKKDASAVSAGKAKAADMAERGILEASRGDGKTEKKPSMLDAPDLPEQSDLKKQELAEEEAKADQAVIDAYIAKADPKTRGKLNEIGGRIKDSIKGLAKPGDRGSIKIGGKSVPIMRGNGSMLSIGGLWTTSMRGAALMVHGLEQATQSGGMMASGVMNAGMAQQGAARATVEAVHHQGNKAAAELARAKAVVRQLQSTTKDKKAGDK